MPEVTPLPPELSRSVSALAGRFPVETVNPDSVGVDSIVHP